MGNYKVGRGSRDTSSRFTKLVAGTGVTKVEMGNLFENFKTDIFNTFPSQLDVFQAKKKQEEVEKALVVFYSICRKKHPLRECPASSIEVCQICEDDHSTDKCPSLPKIKATYLVDQEVVNSLYAMAPQKQWPSRPTSMSQQHSQFPYTKNQMCNFRMPFETWPPQ